MHHGDGGSFCFNCPHTHNTQEKVYKFLQGGEGEEEEIGLIMEKLKSSIKSLQEAITSLKQTGPNCVKEAKTHSFREGEGLCSTFNYVYRTSSPSLCHQEPAVHMKDLSSSLSSSSSSSSSSSQPTDGRISSKRFFFSPRKSKSIMEEVKEDESLFKTAETSNGKTIASGFYEESEAMAMVSKDPYIDFKCSLAEMVEAHEIREWPKLQQLLHCYLRLNNRENHKIIVLAFVDLLMQLMAEDKEMFSFSSDDSLCLCICDFEK